MYRLKFIVLALFLSVVCTAQTPVKETLWQQAQRQFDTQAYAKAVALYVEALDSKTTATESQRRQAELNIGYAYLQLGDNVRAQEYYQRALAGTELNGGAIGHYLHYAKVLANNNKINESQQYYDLYQTAKAAEDRKTQGMQTLTKRKISYRIDLLDINTPDAEFSPMYFRDGLVYVSGKAASSISSESTQKGYLDLFYVSKHDEIKAVNDGTKSNVRKTTPGNGRRLGDDAYTRPTSNDSRTVGNYNGYGLNIGSAVGAGTTVVKPGKPVSFSKELNTRFHEGPATFSADGSQIIFTRNNFNEGQKGVSEDNNIKLKLYSARWGGNDWIDVKELPFNSDEYSTAHPSLSKDGTLLYFVSDAPRGVGGKDIYVSRWEGNQWTTPINLGKEINTKQDEVFPFIDSRGNLYFSSAGRKGGLGGLDIYYAILSKDGTKVIEVLRLDEPINSKADDFGLVTDDARSLGYFSSNRREGDDDIYRFTRESSIYECRELLLRVFDNETSQIIDSATIEIRSTVGGDAIKEPLQTDANGWAKLCLASDNDFIFAVNKAGFLKNTVGFSTRHLNEDKPTRLEIGLMKPIIQEIIIPVDTVPQKVVMQEDSMPKTSRVRGIVRTETDQKPIEGVLVKLRSECDKKIYRAVTGPDGRYEFEIKEGCDYTIIYSKDTYGTNTEKLKKIPKKEKPELVSKDVRLLKKGDVVKLDNIYFDNGQNGIRNDAARELDKVVQTMKKYPSLRVEILSHTDSRGDEAFNKSLSQKRAQSVADYMATKGISRTRVKATGMGESMLISGCIDGMICTDAEYQRDRRTEFKVLEIK